MLTALFFGVLCFALAVGLLTQVPRDLAGASKQNLDLRGSYVADAAIKDTMAWMSFQLTNGVEPCTLSDPSPLRTGGLDGWTWRCLIEPDSGTPPNPVSNLRIYKLTAVASLDGIDRYQIVSDVQGGQSFARFSMFIDEDDPSLWDFGVGPYTRVTGPVHKNRAIRFLVETSIYSGSPPSTTPFDGTVSTSQSSNIWSSGGDPAVGNRYDYIFSGGASDLRTGIPPRPLPGDSSILARAAFGGLPTVTTGVVVNPAGGVFINGDVDDMEMRVNGSGDFELIIRQGPDTTTIVEETATGQRIVNGPSGTYSVAGRGTGVIFATGSINSLHGQNKGDHTIAVDFDSSKNIEISGNITRSDTAIGAKPAVTDDRLGLVAEHVYVADESVLPRNVATPLYLYATILATQRFEVKNAHSGSPGSMALFGGVSGKYTWRVNTSSSGGVVIHGYGGLTGRGTPDLHYDELLATDPPPEYPTTGETELFVRSWREKVL